MRRGLSYEMLREFYTEVKILLYFSGYSDITKGNAVSESVVTKGYLLFWRARPHLFLFSHSDLRVIPKSSAIFCSLIVSWQDMITALVYSSMDSPFSTAVVLTGCVFLMPSGRCSGLMLSESVMRTARSIMFF